MPRKFKIAVSGSPNDRAATLVHDIGVHVGCETPWARSDSASLVGGGMGRTPIIGHVIREFLPRQEVLNYFDAILLRVYKPIPGRRDNIYKARIKILVTEMTPPVFAGHAEAEWERFLAVAARRPCRTRRSRGWRRPSSRRPYEKLFPTTTPDSAPRLWTTAGSATGVKRNVFSRSSVPGYAVVTLSSLKRRACRPATRHPIRWWTRVADLADAYSFGELRVSHEQNLIFSDVRQKELPALWSELKALGYRRRT